MHGPEAPFYLQFTPACIVILFVNLVNQVEELVNLLIFNQQTCFHSMIMILEQYQQQITDKCNDVLIESRRVQNEYACKRSFNLNKICYLYYSTQEIQSITK